MRDEHSAKLGRAVLAASFVLVTLAGNDAVGQTFVWAYRHSAMVLGVLVLLIYFTALVIERSRRHSPTYWRNPVWRNPVWRNPVGLRFFSG